jgi:hypothetical protein
MDNPTIRLQILEYIKANTDNRRLVSYQSICENIKGTNNDYIATALNRLLNERLVFQIGTQRSYGYGITAKGLEYLKTFENKQEVSKLTKLLQTIAGLR